MGKLNTLPILFSIRAGALALIVWASPARASDFSGFSIYVLAIGAGFAAAGFLVGLVLARLLPNCWMTYPVRTAGAVFVLGLLLSMALKPFALAFLCGPALVTWVLVAKGRRDRNAR